MEIKGKTLQEHIWNSMEDMEEPYSVWDWIILFEHFKIPIKRDKDYSAHVKELKEEGKL